MRPSPDPRMPTLPIKDPRRLRRGIQTILGRGQQVVEQGHDPRIGSYKIQHAGQNSSWLPERSKRGRLHTGLMNAGLSRGNRMEATIPRLNLLKLELQKRSQSLDLGATYDGVLQRVECARGSGEPVVHPTSHAQQG